VVPVIHTNLGNVKGLGKIVGRLLVSCGDGYDSLLLGWDQRCYYVSEIMTDQARAGYAPSDLLVRHFKILKIYQKKNHQDIISILRSKQFLQVEKLKLNIYKKKV
jgi:hypothetical protein